jgi:hypothetical protein
MQTRFQSRQQSGETPLLPQIQNFPSSGSSTSFSTSFLPTPSNQFSNKPSTSTSNKFSSKSSQSTSNQSSKSNKPLPHLTSEGRLKNEEKQRRKDNNLCLYCGKHPADVPCRLKPQVTRTITQVPSLANRIEPIEDESKK